MTATSFRAFPVLSQVVAIELERGGVEVFEGEEEKKKGTHLGITIRGGADLRSCAEAAAGAARRRGADSGPVAGWSRC